MIFIAGFYSNARIEAEHLGLFLVSFEDPRHGHEIILTDDLWEMVPPVNHAPVGKTIFPGVINMKQNGDRIASFVTAVGQIRMALVEGASPFPMTVLGHEGPSWEVGSLAELTSWFTREGARLI